MTLDGDMGGADVDVAIWPGRGGGLEGTQDQGLAVGSLFHFMQTLTHTLKELKNNTLNHTVSVPTAPSRHRKTLG